MSRAPRLLLASILACLLVLIPTRPACAQFDLKGLGPSGAQVAGVAIGVGAILGVGLYLILRHPRVTGCATSDPGGLELRRESTPAQTYLLTGDTTHLTPGSRIKVSGERHKDAAGHRTFKVESLKKVYGLCQAAAPQAP